MLEIGGWAGIAQLPESVQRKAAELIQRGVVTPDDFDSRIVSGLRELGAHTAGVAVDRMGTSHLENIRSRAGLFMGIIRRLREERGSQSQQQQQAQAQAQAPQQPQRASSTAGAYAGYTPYPLPGAAPTQQYGSALLLATSQQPAYGQQQQQQQQSGFGYASAPQPPQQQQAPMSYGGSYGYPGAPQGSAPAAYPQQPPSGAPGGYPGAAPQGFAQ